MSDVFLAERLHVRVKRVAQYYTKMKTYPLLLRKLVQLQIETLYESKDLGSGLRGKKVVSQDLGLTLAPKLECGGLPISVGDVVIRSKRHK